MPQIRFTRDRRGYENTFLVHRDRAQRADKPAILYWFRTPPDIRVGRTPLDEDAIRRLERAHPEIRFDWAQLRERASEATGAASRADRQAGEKAAQPQRPRRRRARPRTGPPQSS